MSCFIIGILGMLCIIIAWIPQTLRTIRTKKTGMEPTFLWIYFIGGILLASYAFSINDLIFLAMNSIAAILDATNPFYYYAYERKSKGKKK
jgi:uncharacterized protein with PQ loop repeat